MPARAIFCRKVFGIGSKRGMVFWLRGKTMEPLRQLWNGVDTVKVNFGVA